MFVNEYKIRLFIEIGPIVLEKIKITVIEEDICQDIAIANMAYSSKWHYSVLHAKQSRIGKFRSNYKYCEKF